MFYTAIFNFMAMKISSLWRFMSTIIYHNARCSKSRAALAILEENNLDFEIIRYLETPP